MNARQTCVLAAPVITALFSLGCADMWGQDENDIARCAPSSGVRPPVPETDGTGERISVGAVSKTVRALHVDVDGVGKGSIGPIRWMNGVGTTTADCAEVATVAYAFAYGATDTEGVYVHAFGIAKDRAYLVQMRCIDDALDSLWVSSTDGTYTSEYASGICHVDTTRFESVAVELPAMDFPVPRPIGGFTIDGPEIHLPSGARGTISQGGGERAMVAFHGVDCRTGCKESPYALLDVIIWGPGQGLTLASLSLDAPGSPVQLYARIELPSVLIDYQPVTFDASFTTP